MSGRKKQMVALAAPSGGGKTTLCRMLLEKYPATCVSISFTTRAPRGGERDGVEYHFVSKEKFQALISSGDLVEWAEVHGNFYGTSRRYLEEQCGQGRVVLLDIDVQGVASLKTVFDDRCLSIFILPPSLGELESRLRARQTESEEKIRARIANAAAELAHAPGFDHRIINRDLQQSFNELCQIVEKEAGLG